MNSPCYKKNDMSNCSIYGGRNRNVSKHLVNTITRLKFVYIYNGKHCI